MPSCGSVGSGTCQRPCSPSIFHGYSEVAALGHASFNLARSTRAVKTLNPRRPIAFPCCRRLLYVQHSKSFSLPSSLTLVRASAFQQLPFQVVPALKYRARRSWISWGRCFCCEIVVPSCNKIARASCREYYAPQSTKLRSRFSFRSDRALRNLTSIRTSADARDSDYHPLIRLVFVMSQSQSQTSILDENLVVALIVVSRFTHRVTIYLQKLRQEKSSISLQPFVVTLLENIKLVTLRSK